MDIPEITYNSALESKPWKPVDAVLPEVVYIDHLTSYEVFFKNILLKNQLCIIGPESTSNWVSRKNWVMVDESPDFAYLLGNFGESVAPVADCNSEEFCAHPKTEMTVKEYLTYWQNYRSQGHNPDAKCLYLKDWHFVRDFPDYCEYTTPAVLSSDWMNEFWDVWKDKGETDDYRFVYMGPKNSWTPFHADVLHSYSWSANICGKKKWIFYPPGEEGSLKDKHGHLVFDLRSPDLQDLQKYPAASATTHTAITVLQNPGEIVFIPSGWHHQVFNLEDTISINHNWMNGCSAHLSWEYIKERLVAVQKEIKDCQGMEGWHQHCQVILKADSGIDYLDFYNFIATIAAHRMTVLNLYLERNYKSGVLNLPYSFKHVIPPAGDNKMHNEDSTEDDCDEEKESINNLTGIQCKDNSERRKVCWSCSQTQTQGMYRTDSEQYARLDEADASIREKNPFASKDIHCHVSLSSTKQPTLAEDEVSKEVYKAGLEFSNVEKSSKPSHSFLRNISRQNQNIKRLSYLCLFKGVIVDKASDLMKISESDGNKGHRNKIFSEGTVKDDVNHRSCPHWAHCGPNLALFDLCRVLDIALDMNDQAEFKVILEDASSRVKFYILPSELIVQIQSIIRMTLAMGDIHPSRDDICIAMDDTHLAMDYMSANR